MIFGTISQKDTYGFLPEKINQCFSYIQKNDLLTFEKGTYEIDGTSLFVNIVEYETTQAKHRFWEAHKSYLDLHYMLQGKEQIDLNFISNMEQKDYVEKDDFLPLEGEKNSCVILSKGDFLICYPEDGHKTAVMLEQPQKIKKAIFKIKIKE